MKMKPKLCGVLEIRCYKVQGYLILTFPKSYKLCMKSNLHLIPILVLIKKIINRLFNSNTGTR